MKRNSIPPGTPTPHSGMYEQVGTSGAGALANRRIQRDEIPYRQRISRGRVGG